MMCSFPIHCLLIVLFVPAQYTTSHNHSSVCVRSVRGTTWVNAWTGGRTPLGLEEVAFAPATRVCAVVGAVCRLLWTCMLVCAITTAFSPPFQGVLALCACVFARACKYIAMSLLFVLLALCVHSVLMSHLLTSAALACLSADGHCFCRCYVTCCCVVLLSALLQLCEGLLCLCFPRSDASRSVEPPVPLQCMCVCVRCLKNKEQEQGQEGGIRQR